MRRPLIIALAAIAVLVSAITRPPGVMPVASQGGITYEICSEGVLRIVTIAPDGSPKDAPQGERTDGATLCKFFAVQAALPGQTAIAIAVPTAAADKTWVRTASTAPTPSPLRQRHPPRAPPVV